MTGLMRGEQPLATLSKKMNKPIAQVIQRAERREPLPLSYAQQRLWFLDQLESQSPVFNVPSAVRLCGELNVPALARSLNEIIRRHEALRTRFPSIDGTPAQEIVETIEATIHYIDLSMKSGNDRRP